jgi:hypothetical protein
VLEIQTGVWPHAEETEVSPSGPPVPSNNDGSHKKVAKQELFKTRRMASEVYYLTIRRRGL